MHTVTTTYVTDNNGNYIYTHESNSYSTDGRKNNGGNSTSNSNKNSTDGRKNNGGNSTSTKNSTDGRKNNGGKKSTTKTTKKHFTTKGLTNKDVKD